MAISVKQYILKWDIDNGFVILNPNDNIDICDVVVLNKAIDHENENWYINIENLEEINEISEIPFPYVKNKKDLENEDMFEFIEEPEERPLEDGSFSFYVEVLNEECSHREKYLTKHITTDKECNDLFKKCEAHIEKVLNDFLEPSIKQYINPNSEKRCFILYRGK